jgi:hypothetical protein
MNKLDLLFIFIGINRFPLSSVVDTDPEPLYPYVFWAFRIRIRMRTKMSRIHNKRPT